MNTTTEKAVLAFRLLNNAKLSKMEDDDKYLVIKAMRELKPIAIQYDDFIKDAAEKLKPEGIEPIQQKLQKNEQLTDNEQQVWVKYNNNISHCLNDELKKEIQLNFKPLREEAIKGLMASNDFSVAEIMLLEEVLS